MNRSVTIRLFKRSSGASQIRSAAWVAVAELIRALNIGNGVVQSDLDSHNVGGMKVDIRHGWPDDAETS
jgi:hypothetical protein